MVDPIGTINFMDDGAGLRLLINEGGSLHAWRIQDCTVKRLHAQLGWYLEKIRRNVPEPIEGEPEERHIHDR